MSGFNFDDLDETFTNTWALWEWLTSSELSFAHFVCMAAVVFAAIAAASHIHVVTKTRRRTAHALSHGALLGVNGVTHVSAAVVCKEVVAVGRTAPSFPVVSVLDPRHTTTAAAPRPTTRSTQQLDHQRGAASAAAPALPSALKDTSSGAAGAGVGATKKKHASVVWADDVFRMATEARVAAAAAPPSPSAAMETTALHSSSSSSYYANTTHGGSSVASTAVSNSVNYSDQYSHHHQAQQHSHAASQHYHAVSSSSARADSSSSSDEGNATPSAAQRGNNSSSYGRDRASNTSAAAQRRSSSKENQRFSKRSTARAMRAGKVTLLAGTADVMANAALTKAVSPTLVAAMGAPGPLPPLHVGACALNTVLDASMMTSGDALRDAPASASFAPAASHRLTSAHGRRSPLQEELEVAQAYGEEWARRLGCTAPPRRQHRRENMLEAYASHGLGEAARSDDATARGRDAHTTVAYPSGLGVFCAAPQQSSVGGGLHSANARGSALQAMTGLDFSAIEQPLPPLIARLPTPPPQPVAVKATAPAPATASSFERATASAAPAAPQLSGQSPVASGLFTPVKPVAAATPSSATSTPARVSSLSFGPRPTSSQSTPSKPFGDSARGALPAPTMAPQLLPSTTPSRSAFGNGGAAKPPAEEAASASTTAPQTPTPAPSSGDDGARGNVAQPATPNAGSSVSAAPSTGASVDQDGFKVPSPVVRPVALSPTAAPESPVAPPAPVASSPSPATNQPQPSAPTPAFGASAGSGAFGSRATLPPQQRPPRYSDEAIAAATPPQAAAAAQSPTPAFSISRGAPTMASARPAPVNSGASASAWGTVKTTPTPGASLFAGLAPQRGGAFGGGSGAAASPSVLVHSRTAPTLGAATSPWESSVAPQRSSLSNRSRSSSGGSSSGGGHHGGSGGGRGSGHRNSGRGSGSGSPQNQRGSARQRQSY